MENTYFNIEDPELSFDKIKFTRSKNKSGRRFIGMFYNNNDLGITLPKFKVPFDVKLYNDNKLDLNVSVDRESVVEKFNELDAFVHKQAISEGWVKDDSIFHVSVRNPNVGYSPLYKFKVQSKNDILFTKFFDKDDAKLNINNIDDIISLLKKGTSLSSALVVAGVWINKFDDGFEHLGITYIAKQIKHFSAPVVTKIQQKESDVDSDTYDFNSDSDSDIENL